MDRILTSAFVFILGASEVAAFRHDDKNTRNNSPMYRGLLFDRQGKDHPALSPSTPAGPNGSVPSTPTKPIGAVKTGLLTMWTTDAGAVKGSSCEIASDTSTSQRDTWLNPYVTGKRFCALNDALNQGGLGCGSCYNISYDGQGGTDPGRAGSAIVQAVDSGSAKEFDCFIDVFTEITGATTGIFTVSYQQVECDVQGGPTVVVIDGGNKYYSKVMVTGGKSGPKKVECKVGNEGYVNLPRVGTGSTFGGSVGNGQSAVPTMYKVTFADGFVATIGACFADSYPPPTGSVCSLSAS